MINPSKPNEIICMTKIYMPTQEGEAIIFGAFDQYSHFCFMMEIYDVENEAIMMDAVGKLTKNKDFHKFDHKDFTLMVDFGEEILEELNMIAEEHEGKVVFDPDEVRQATKEDLDSLFENFGPE